MHGTAQAAKIRKRGVGAALIGGVAGFIMALSPLAAWARELGVDVSHFQGDFGMPQANWNQLAAEGRVFAFIKSTEGLLPPGNIDNAWPTNVARATSAGIVNGVYHFARPDNRPTTMGAVQEANFFVDTAGSAMTPGHLRPVIDLERGNALSTEALTDWVLAFVDTVVGRLGPGGEPIIYTTASYAVNELDSRVAHLDLWIRADFGDPQTGAPFTTGVFNDWSIWQYNVGPAGGINPIDQNVIHSETTSLASLLIVPEPTGWALATVGAAVIGATRRRGRLGASWRRGVVERRGGE